MTYQGGRGFYTQPVQEPSDYDPEDEGENEFTNGEYDINEIMEDGGDQFATHRHDDEVGSQSENDKQSIEYVPRSSRRRQHR